MSHLVDLGPVYRRAAEIIQRNGHWPHDYLPDSMHRVSDLPDVQRPMSAAAALWCAVTGDPSGPSELADDAIRYLAARLLVEGASPRDESRTSDCELHLAAWGSAPQRTAEAVVVELLRAAEAVERGPIVPVGVRTADGSRWRLASIVYGTPRYVLDGMPEDVPVGVQVELGELADVFGTVSAWGSAA